MWVPVEPSLQPLTGEQVSCRTANVEDGAHLDVVAGIIDRMLILTSRFSTLWLLLIVLSQCLTVIDG